MGIIATSQFLLTFFHISLSFIHKQVNTVRHSICFEETSDCCIYIHTHIYLNSRLPQFFPKKNYSSSLKSKIYLLINMIPVLLRNMQVHLSSKYEIIKFGLIQSYTAASFGSQPMFIYMYIYLYIDGVQLMISFTTASKLLSLTLVCPKYCKHQKCQKRLSNR